MWARHTPGTVLGTSRGIHWQGLFRRGGPALRRGGVLLNPCPCLPLAHLRYSQHQSIPEAGTPLVRLPPAWHDLTLLWATLAGPSLRGAETDTVGWLLGIPDQACSLSGDWVWDPISEGQSLSVRKPIFKRAGNMSLQINGLREPRGATDQSVLLMALSTCLQ